MRLCSNGVECLKALEQELPDLMLLDIMMPVMDGLEVLRRIRSEARYSDLPVIMMSAVKPREANPGWQMFIQKPFNITVLLQGVHKLIGSSSQAENA